MKKKKTNKSLSPEKEGYPQEIVDVVHNSVDNSKVIH